MKKVMVSAVILLPLVILLVLLISGTVVGSVEHIYVERLEFTEQETLVLTKGGEEKPQKELEVLVFPRAATNQKLVFSSSDESVVTVDEKGVVYGEGYGEAYIYAASAENASLRIGKRVLVTDSVVHEVAFETSADVLYAGKSTQFSVSVKPKEAEDKTILWESSDPSVLSVAADGTVTAKKAGTAKIVARSAVNAAAYAECTVECKAPVQAVSVEDASPVVMAGYEAVFPQLVFTPAEASEPAVYTVSDEAVASVDGEGNILFKKAGKVTVTATVTDGAGNTASVSKEYTCTGGYYAGLRFEKTQYTFTYAENEPVALSFTGTPSGADKGFEGVSFSQEGVLEYRDGKFYTVGTSKGGVIVTVRAKTYDGQTVSAACTVAVLRSAEEIVPEEEAVSETRDRIDLAALVSVSPANHTDTLRYSVNDGEVASVENGYLQFKAEGRVIVTVTAENAEGVTAECSFAVTYRKETGEVTAQIGEDSAASVTMGDIAFDGQTGFIDVRLSEEYTEISYTVTEGKDVVSVDALGRVTPKKGGSAVITVRAERAGAARSGEAWVRQVHVYVDRSADDIAFSRAFTVTVSPADAMEGKELRLSAENASVTFERQQDADGNAVYACKAVFKGAGEVEITAGIYRGGEEKQGKRATLYTTYGNVQEGGFTLTQGGAAAADGAAYTIADVGGSLVFELGSSFTPADFVPSEENLSVSAGASLSAEVKQENGVWKFTVTAAAATGGKAESVTFTVGGRTLTVQVTVNACAQQLQASCGDTAFAEGAQYDTLLSSLVITVRLTRADGAAVTQQKVLWSYNGASGEAVCTGGVGTFTLPVADGADEKLVLTSADGGAELSVQLKKIAVLEDFGVALRYTTAGGEQAVAAEFASIRSLTAQTVRLPNAMQGSLTLQFLLPQNLVGSYTDEEFAALFRVGAPAGWAAAYEGELLAAILTPAAASSFRADVTVNHEDAVNFTLTLLKTDVQGIEFIGYSHTNEDVFLGYQQVRVFAKHSYYSGKTVDYYKIPWKVTDADGSGDGAEYIEFTLTPYKGAGPDADAKSTRQSGRSVFYGGKTYTIQADGSLLDESGAVAVTAEGKNTAGVTFVDPFTEAGYLRIYFGSFNGLSETDVQNDAFGDFGEGLDKRTAESGTFLKVAASDGAAGGVSASYNFNVMNDPSGATLVNVADAEGYLNNKYVVLQASLYHDAELSESEKTERAAQVLTSTDSGKLSKTLTYGNGFSVNFGAFNASVGENTGLSQGKVYNAVLKGTTASAGDSKKNFNIYFTGTRFYYCDIQACHKGLSVSGSNPTYIKNCVFRYHEDSSIFIYQTGTAYVENVFIIDGGDVAMEYTTGTFKFKGFVDGINFKNSNDLKEVTLGMEFLANKVLNELKTSYSSYIWYDAGGELYANIVVASISVVIGGHTMKGVDFYDPASVDYVTFDPKEKEVQTDAGTGMALLYENVSLAKILLVTYENTDAPEDGEYSFIGYNCQYKDVNGSRTLNTEHIAWHAQRVHRDLSVVPAEGGGYGWDIGDHTENLQASLAA